MTRRWHPSSSSTRPPKRSSTGQRPVYQAPPPGRLGDARTSSLCYFQDVIRLVADEYGAEVLITLASEIGPNVVYRLEHAGVPIALAHPGVGAPLAAGFLEELIGLGGRSFVAVGGAGALVSELTLGHVIVPTAAIRDEGTSYHYLPPAREIEPTPEVLDALVATLEERAVPYVKGKTWTTDAIFRETRGAGCAAHRRGLRVRRDGGRGMLRGRPNSGVSPSASCSTPATTCQARSGTTVAGTAMPPGAKPFSASPSTRSSSCRQCPSRLS